jgi:creatinine amidohydrolase/Fe(II)-dependent formamide hydrolase-like protein
VFAHQEVSKAAALVAAAVAEFLALRGHLGAVMITSTAAAAAVAAAADMAVASCIMEDMGQHSTHSCEAQQQLNHDAVLFTQAY